MLLRLSDVQASYVGLRALDGIDLAVPDGGGVAVVGANGAGKSTLANSIIGLKKIDSGTIEFAGKPASPRGYRRVRDGMGYVPEGRRLFGDLTVHENLQVACRQDGREQDRRIQDVCDLFPRVGERLDQKAGQLSGGEQTMVAIARAMVDRPRLLVVEEPSKSLAPVVTQMVREYLQQARERGVGLLLFEQQIHRVRELVDEVHILVRGRIAGHGPASDEHLEDLLATSVVGSAARAESAPEDA